MRPVTSALRVGSGALALAATTLIDSYPAAATECRDASALSGNAIGAEIGAPQRLRQGDLHRLSIREVRRLGRSLFEAVWTPQEGGGRPFTNGVGGALADPGDPLLFPRNFNRVSAPDANACSGCHNLPFSGGGGDIVANVFVTAQRLDHATFDPADDATPRKGSTDEYGELVTLQTVGNSRATLGMFGAGFIELLAREMTADLRRMRDRLAPGEAASLRSKGVDFGTLARNPEGSYDTSAVLGLPRPSLVGEIPGLQVRPFHQVGNVVSLREFTNNAYNHHHGIQTAERFGAQADPDGDGFCNEMTKEEVTAVALWQATLRVPIQVVPRERERANAILLGEHLFDQIGCASCHIPELPLEDSTYSEPNPFNPPGNLQLDGGDPVIRVDLTSDQLPSPRLRARGGRVMVPAYTDLRLHDITTGPHDPNCEPLNQNAAGTDGFTAGNCRFLTKKLWGAGNEPPFFHHGQFTTLRRAILNHFGEAEQTRQNFEGLPSCGRDAVVEFLKSLQVGPAGTTSTTVDEDHAPRSWPPANRKQRLRQAMTACPLS